jgi:uncharacterized protein (TIGR00369 family)
MLQGFRLKALVADDPFIGLNRKRVKPKRAIGMTRTPPAKPNEAPGAQSFMDRFDAYPFHQYLGMKLEHYRENYACVTLTQSADGPKGIGDGVHGGALATLVDMSAVAAVFSNLGPGEIPAGTADLQITYLRPARGKQIRCEATVLKRGRHLATVEAKVIREDGELCCDARVLYAFRAGGS